MNEFRFLGILLDHSETTMSKTGKEILTFRIAVNSGSGVYKKVAYIRIKAFGKSAEWHRGMMKGQGVIVLGSVDTGSYEKDGSKMFYTDFIANQIHKVVSLENEESSEDIY